jgi:hypothetical protein
LITSFKTFVFASFKIFGDIGDLYQRRSAIVTHAEHQPIRIGDERERLVAVSPAMTKSWSPSWGETIPGERPRETAET